MRRLFRGMPIPGLLIVVLAAGVARTAFCVEIPASREPFYIHLRQESFRPAPMDEFELERQLTLLRQGASEGERVHALMQLEDPASPSLESDLSRRGVDFLRYVPYDTWLVSMPVTVSADEIGGSVRWLSRLDSVWKMAPRLAQRGVASWSRTDDGKARLIVKFMPDVPLDIGMDLLTEWDLTVEAEIPVSHGFRVTADETRIEYLIDQDAVLYVTDLPPPKVEDNDGSRVNCGAEVLQAAPLELDGSGIDLAIWDSGAVSEEHADFSGRLILGNISTTSYHGTHVAGTMAGSGSLSVGEGGTPLQWRGMAPAAGIISYDWNDFLLEYDSAINTYGADISQNSWGLGISETQENCDLYGDYSDGSPELDDIVTGFHGTPIIIVFSAGNERDDGDCGIEARGGYACIGPLKSAKNVITVGGIHSDNDSMTEFSSWGPLDDGRLKPDVVAPGCEYAGEGYIHSTLPPDIYGAPGYCGTSMAAPAVSGCAALLLELWEQIHPASPLPLPCTVKALILAAARDLGNPGPDYSFGYGALDVERAAEQLMTAGVVTDSVAASETDEIVFRLPSAGGPDSLSVTMVWDDVPGLELATPALVNDLDLVLEDPVGGLHYPWVLDPGDPSLPATTGTDAINNVEQVSVASPSSGVWRARVTGTSVPDGPQGYTLVGLDLQAPPAIQTLIVSSPVENEAHIRWLNPEDIDVTGSLLVRSDSPITWVPTQGISYTIDEEVAPGVIVRWIGSGDHSIDPLVDAPLDGGITYHYGVASYDRWLNYATMATDSVTVSGGTIPRVGLAVPMPYTPAASDTATAIATVSTPLDSSTVDSASVFLVGGWSGPRPAEIRLESGGLVLEMSPTDPFLPGEEVRVSLTDSLRSVSGGPLIGGYQWAYTIRTGGSGTGSFQHASETGAGSSPVGIEAADFDGDGLNDVAVTVETLKQLRIYLNQGDGSFSLVNTYDTGSGPVVVRGGDLDRDASIDLVIADRSDGTYHSFLGDGSGGFVSLGPLSLPGSAEDIVLADLNGDGRLDLLAALGFLGQLAVGFGQGDGTFGSFSTHEVDGSPQGLVVIDVNRDGLLDVAMTSSSNDSLFLWQNVGKGALVRTFSFGTGAYPAAVAAADFTGDWAADLAVLERDDGTLSIFRGVAGGTFLPPQSYFVGDTPWGLEVGDVDADGDLDLVATLRVGGNIALLRNQGGGSFATPEETAAGVQPRGLALLDAEGDRDLDVVLVRGLATGRLITFTNEPGTDVSSLDIYLVGVKLLPASPNPMNPAARIRFHIPQRAPVSLKVFDSRGRLVSSLIDETREAGWHETVWSGNDQQGRPAASGVYFLLLETDGIRQGQKLVIVK